MPPKYYNILVLSLNVIHFFLTDFISVIIFETLKRIFKEKIPFRKGEIFIKKKTFIKIYYILVYIEMLLAVFII